MNQLRGGSIAAAGRNGDAGFNASAAAAGSSEQAFFRLDLRRSLQLHRQLARTVALAGVALAVLYLLVQVFWFKSWPAYRSDSTVYVQPTPGKVLPAEGGAPRWPSDSNTYETYIQQQMANVSRQDVLMAALHKLDGFEKPGESDQEAARRLVRKLEVTRRPDAYQFTISARESDPETAAQIANAVTAAYIESASRDERAGDAQRLAMLKEEKDRIQAALTADRAEQDDLNKQLGVAAVGGALPDHFDQDIAQIRTDLAKARTDHDQAEQKFAALDAGHGPSSTAIDAEADEMVASDAGLVSMKQVLNQRRAFLISQMANLTPLNPQYKLDEAELVKINSTLDAMAKDLRAKAAARIQLQLRSELQRTGGVESQLNSQLRQLVAAATSAAPKMQRSSDLAADIARLQNRYAIVDEQWHNLMLEDSAPAAAYQVTPAVAPMGRSKSGVLRDASLIVLAGLFAALLAAITAQKLDPRLYIAADVERVLGYAPLAQLPDFGEVSEGVAAEYTLRLASAIEHGRKQGNLKNCIFTGTAPGAGVSTLVNRVREMLEAMGRPTVLVDATGPHAPARADAVTHAGMQGLMPMPRVSRPTALLQQMADRTETEEETLVLTDTAPLLVSAETEYLARFVDCAIVVIESGVTTRAQLRETATALQRLSVGVVGFVLNRVGMAKADPAFRSAVEAVEQHLQAQAQSTARAEEQRPSAPQSSRAQDALPKAPPSRSNFEPEVAAAAAAVARFSPPPRAVQESAARPETASVVDQPSVCQSSPMVDAPVAAAAKRFSMPFVTEPIVADEPFTESAKLKSTAANPGAEPTTKPAPPASPFAEAAGRFSPSLPTGPEVLNPPRPVSIPPLSNSLPVGPEESQTPAAAYASVPVAGGQPAPVPQQQPAASANSEVPWWLTDMARMQEPQRPPVIWQAAKARPDREQTDGEKGEPGAPRAVPQQRQPWRLDPSPRSASVETAPLPVDTTPEPAAAHSRDAGANRTSRLSGLRNLLFVLGVKDGRGAEEGASHAEEIGSKFDHSTEAESSRRTVLETQDHAPRHNGGSSPRLVTALPEFLPPRPPVIEFDKGDSRAGDSSTRQDRRASADGVEILPSQRGQYKKL